MTQTPGTTLMHLIDIGRDLDLGGALAPVGAMRAIQNIQVALTDDGRLTDQSLRDRPQMETFNWHLPGVAVTGIQGGAQRVAQGGPLTRIGIHARTAPTGTLVVWIMRETATSGMTDIENIALRAGETKADLPVSNEVLLAGSWLGVRVAATGGAADISITVTERVG